MGWMSETPVSHSVTTNLIPARYIDGEKTHFFVLIRYLITLASYKWLALFNCILTV